MSFGASVKHVLGNYATFSGRASRSEFWWFYLFVILVSAVLNVIDAVLGLRVGAMSEEFIISGTAVPFVSSGVGVLSTIFALAMLLPFLAVGVRRLHDSDKSGWLLLLGYLLICACGIGLIVLLVLFVLKSTPGDNKYGPPAPMTI